MTKEHLLLRVHKAPKPKVKDILESLASLKYIKDAELEKDIPRKIELLSKAYRASKSIDEKILVYKEGKGELGKDIFFKNIKTDILSKVGKDIETLNKIFWNAGRELSNEAAQKLENLKHGDNCKCEICSRYHKKEVGIIKKLLKKAKNKDTSTKYLRKETETVDKEHKKVA